MLKPGGHAPTPRRCGLRPYSADGIILLGRLHQLENLSLNVGPGFTGWKISVGAAAVVAAGLSGELEEAELPFRRAALEPGARVARAAGWGALMAATRERAGRVG